jgi:hypothetical protein
VARGEDDRDPDRILFAVFIHEHRNQGHLLRPDTNLLTLSDRATVAIVTAQQAGGPQTVGPPPYWLSRDRSVERKHQNGVAELIVELEVAAGGDRDVLLAIEIERHRRRVDARTGVE